MLALRAAAEIVSLGLTAFVTIWIGRVVGPTNLGYYAVLLAVFQLGIVFVNAGLPTAASQRVANDPLNSQTEWWVVSTTRLAIGLLTLLLAEAAIRILPIDPRLSGLLAVGLLAWPAQAFRSEWLLVSHGLVGYASLLRIVGVVTTATVAVSAIRAEADAGRLALLIVLPWTVLSILGVLVARQHQLIGPRPRPRVLWAQLRDLRTPMRHFLSADLGVYLYTSSDRIILYLFANSTVVGLYDAAYRLIQPFYSVASVASDTMFKQIAEARTRGADSLIVRRYVDVMFIATIPVGFATAIFAPFIVEIAYGDRFMDAAGNLAILGWVITFGFVSGAAAFPFTAWNLPQAYARTVVAGTVVNMALNVLLIPTLFGMGAAVATVGGKVAASAVGIVYFRRASSYPLIRECAVFAGISTLSTAVAVGSRIMLGLADVACITLFVAVYGGLVFALRLRPYLAPLKSQG
jgi:O-antigen/teichoic acid export membrane protein